jgi:hypothetical protein
MDLTSFFVQQVIIHRVPKVSKGNKADSRPELSGTPSILDARRKAYFRERILTSLTRQAIPVIHDPLQSSEVPELVVEYFKQDGSNLVETSRRMAEHLYEVQTGSSNEGLLTVVEGTLLQGKTVGKCIAILKLENNSALSVDSVEVNGKATFDITIKSVTLSETAEVFKASLFPRCEDLGSLAGIVSDNQGSPAEVGAEIANFFKAKFLGCKYREDPDRSTLEWYRKVEQFANARGSDGAEKAQILRAAVAEIENNKDAINVFDFITASIPSYLQDDALKEFAVSAEVRPVIPKDVSLVAPVIRREVIELTNGLTLQGPRKVVEESVEFTEQGVTIKGAVRSVSTRK